MSNLLKYSIFNEILFPKSEEFSPESAIETLTLRKLVRYSPPSSLSIKSSTLVVFDFETTGLDPNDDHIIEIGAQKLVGLKAVDEFSSLIKPAVKLSNFVSRFTGITLDMLEAAPSVAEVIPNFLKFIEGSILVAHNADFDMAFLKAACSRLGYEISWPCFCTLKMARLLLPELESKNLDSLASHYGLTFEARHRSIGDVKVTTEVLKALLTQANTYESWLDFQIFAVA